MNLITVARNRTGTVLFRQLSNGFAAGFSVHACAVLAASTLSHPCLCRPGTRRRRLGCHSGASGALSALRSSKSGEYLRRPAHSPVFYRENAGLPKTAATGRRVVQAKIDRLAVRGESAVAGKWGQTPFSPRLKPHVEMGSDPISDNVARGSSTGITSVRDISSP